MTTRLKATKTWCEVCNTTRHDSKKCGKVIAYNMILFKYLKVIHFDPYSVTNTYNGERYEKQFLKYAVSYLRKNGCYDPESETRVSVDFEMVTKPKVSQGDVLFFPSHYPHLVSPHRGTRERITFSANFKVIPKGFGDS